MDSGVLKTLDKKIATFIVVELLIILALAFRIPFSGTYVIYPDACTYLSISKSILNGQLYTDFRGGGITVFPPLQPLAISAFYFVLGSFELSALVVSLIAGILLIIPVYFFSRSIFGERPAWMSALFVVLSPVLLNWSVVMQPESLFILLFISTAAIGYYALERDKKGFILMFLAGVAAGLSYLTRIPGILSLGILLIWIVIYSIIKKSTLKKTIIVVLLLFLGFIVVAGPYILYVHSLKGKWTLTSSYGSVKSVVVSEGRETMSEWELLQAKKTEKTVFAKLRRKIITNSWIYGSTLFELMSVTLLFVIAGIIRGYKGMDKSEKLRVLYVLSFVIVYFLSLLILPLSPLIDERMRYLAPVFPLLLILASGGVMFFYDLIIKRFKLNFLRKTAVPAMIVIILLSFIPQYQMVSVNLQKFWDKVPQLKMRKDTGLWMKENLPHPIRAMSRKPFIPYYADAIFYLTPPTLEEVLKSARRNKIDYIVIDRSIDYYLRPQLRFLFDPQKTPKELKLVGGYTNPKTGEIVTGAYRINREK